MTRWRDLPPSIRTAPITNAWIGSDGFHWPLTGLDAGIEGAFVAGPIEGLVHVPFHGVWTSPAYGPPRFERKIDDRKEISLRLGLMSDSELGWFDTESRFWQGCTGESTGYWVTTTLRHGTLWWPMQLLETAKCTLADDPTQSGGPTVAVHDIILAVDGEPTARRPDTAPPAFVRPVGTVDKGILRVANRSTRAQWPIYFLDAKEKTQYYLPDGPNAIASDTINPFDDWPKLQELFGIPFIDEILGTYRRSRDANMLEIPELQKGEHALIDTDPTHRIAITVLDPNDNIIKRYLRNSEFLNWLSGHYGDTGLPLIQRFKGQGFSIPIPARSVATLPVLCDRPGGSVSVQCPQRFESALH